MTEEQRILVTLLAHGDAIHVGLRELEWRGNENANRYFAQLDFPFVGVQIPSAGGPSQSVQQQRMVALLEARGHLVAHRRRGEKLPYARLTSEGDEIARQLCGLPCLAESHAWLHYLLELSATSDNLLHTVDEFRLAPSLDKATSKELVKVEERALPSLCRGWAACHSSLLGLVHYWPTDAGREAAKQPAPTPRGPGVRDDCQGHYYATFKARRNSLAHDRPKVANEIGPTPLLHHRSPHVAPAMVSPPASPETPR